MDGIRENERMEKRAAFDEIRSRLKSIQAGKYPFEPKVEKKWSDLKARAQGARAALTRAEEALTAEQGRKKRLEGDICRKEAELSGLGLFKGAAKRALREQIAALKAAVTAAESAASAKEKEVDRLQKECQAARDAADTFAANAARTEREKLQRQACSVLLGADCVGDNGTVRFGHYESGHGKQPIEWRVIDVGRGILLMAEYGVDCRPYNESLYAEVRYKEDVYEPGSYTPKPIPVTWETCSLRKWLNDDFLRAAFSEEEQSLIQTVKVKADKNPGSEVNAGNATRDRVFLLSVPEAERYLPSGEARKCRATPYARKQGASEHWQTKCTDWWLRSPGKEKTAAAYVDGKGEVNQRGTVVNAGWDKSGTLNNGCVRPVICIGLP